MMEFLDPYGLEYDPSDRHYQDPGPDYRPPPPWFEGSLHGTPEIRLDPVPAPPTVPLADYEHMTDVAALSVAMAVSSLHGTGAPSADMPEATAHQSNPAGEPDIVAELAEEVERYGNRLEARVEHMIPDGPQGNCMTQDKFDQQIKGGLEAVVQHTILEQAADPFAGQ